MKRSILLIVAGCLLLGACAPAAPAPSSTALPTATATAIPSPMPTPTYAFKSPDWQLAWSDEFDEAQINPANWSYDTGGSGWGNLELEDYTNLPDNARLENGRLVIEARQVSYAGMDYTSARLVSRSLQEFQYGRIEARMKLPSGQGMWPAFWLLGGGAAWPYGGEIDIMEYVGKTPDTVYQTAHGPGYSGPNGIGTHYVLPAGSLKNDFHVYAVEWEPEDMRWFVDDKQVFEVTPAQLPAGKAWVFDHPFYIILNLAVGGSWPGNPDGSTTFPQQLLVDYVRVYQKRIPTVTP